jgi:predicted SAM-dependent methyltransferase
MKKLNLGCGPSGINGWINYDWGMLPLVNKYPFLLKALVKIGAIDKAYIVKWPKIRLFDIRKKFGEKDNTVDVVYCSQVLEHFERWEAVGIAKEIYRILKKGGIFRISVPDIKLLIDKYNGDIDADKLAKDIWGFDKHLKPKNLLQSIGRNFIRDHQWLYDKNSMKKMLSKAGFKNIEICEFGKGNTPDLDKLDLEEHRSASMYLEATK